MVVGSSVYKMTSHIRVSRSQILFISLSLLISFCSVFSQDPPATRQPTSTLINTPNSYDVSKRDDDTNKFQSSGSANASANNSNSTDASNAKLITSNLLGSQVNSGSVSVGPSVAQKSASQAESTVAMTPTGQAQPTQAVSSGEEALSSKTETSVEKAQGLITPSAQSSGQIKDVSEGKISNSSFEASEKQKIIPSTESSKDDENGRDKGISTPKAIINTSALPSIASPHNASPNNSSVINALSSSTSPSSMSSSIASFTTSTLATQAPLNDQTPDKNAVETGNGGNSAAKVNITTNGNMNDNNNNKSGGINNEDSSPSKPPDDSNNNFNEDNHEYNGEGNNEYDNKGNNEYDDEDQEENQESQSKNPVGKQNDNPVESKDSDKATKDKPKGESKHQPVNDGSYYPSTQQFIIYFSVAVVIIVTVYVCYHNKTKTKPILSSLRQRLTLLLKREERQDIRYKKLSTTADDSLPSSHGDQLARTYIY